jgi:transcription antitermination factor NusG
MSWVVVYARANSEFAAKKDLQAFNAYCPRQLVRRKPRYNHGRVVIRARPRFANYLFCGGEFNSMMQAIRASRHALGLVRVGYEIAQVDDHVVAALRALNDVPPETPPTPRVGAAIVVTTGLLEGQRATSLTSIRAPHG